MTLNEALDVFGSNGWHTQTVCENYAVVAYDDGGNLARSFDRNRGGSGLARASLTIGPDGVIRSNLLSKWTTNGLHWIRYLSAKRHLREAQ